MNPENPNHTVVPEKQVVQSSNELNEQELASVAVGGADIYPNFKGLYPDIDPQLEDISKKDLSRIESALAPP